MISWDIENMLHNKTFPFSQCYIVMYKLKIYLLILLVSGGFAGMEGQYYVSPAGADSNPGTLQKPFRTIQRAANEMQAGDTCFIMNGIYRETVMPLANGKADAPVVFTAYNGHRVIISGSDTIGAKWERYKDKIYKAYFPEKVLQLFAGKKRAFPARYPNLNKDGDMFDLSDWLPVHASAGGDAVFSRMDFPPDYWKGAYCKILTGHKWIAHLGKISSSSGNTVHCDKRSYPWNDYKPDTYLGDGSGYIIMHLHALDSPNEWHWQNDTLYYCVPDGKKIDDIRFEARTRQYGFDCSGKQNIKVENINFITASVDFGGSVRCTLENCNVLYPVPFYAYTNGWGRNGTKGKDYSIDHWEGKGIHISGKENVVKNCYIAFSWGDGISIGGVGNKVEQCIIENCDWSATDAAPLCVSGKKHLITENTIRNAARSVLVHRICDSTDIVFNDFYNSGFICKDLGLTYSFHTNGGGSEIAYNWVHDNKARGAAFGIYLDNYDTSYVVHHNVIWNCENAIQTNKPAVGHRIYNNTVWHCDKTIGTWGRKGTKIIDQKVINNLSDKAWNTGTYLSHNLTTGNPGFRDPANKDFSLKAGSPAIDYGIIIPVVTDGYRDKAPDAGAYEYGLARWIPGSDLDIPDLTDIVLPAPPPGTKR